MRFSVEKDVLVNALTVTQSVISSRTNLPVLSNVLIKAQDGKIVLSSTDLDIGVKVVVPAKVEGKGGISINSRKLFEFVREIDSEEVLFTVKKNYHIHISAGAVSARFYGLPEEEFPSLPVIKSKTEVQISSQLLSTLIDLTIFSASRETTRYELNGILFELEDGNIRCVASDGKRLSLAETSLNKKIDKSFILPLKAGQELSRFLPDMDIITLKADDNVVSFSWGNIELVSRIIDGQYPQYRQVIPEEKEQKAIINRDIFLSALKRASIFVSTDSYAVRLDFFKNKLIITKDSQDIGSSREELSIIYNGEDIIIGVNPEYLIDMLKTVPLDEIKMELIAPDRPIVIRDELEIDGIAYKYMYLVSPMRI